jgi:hypothetical protein
MSTRTGWGRGLLPHLPLPDLLQPVPTFNEVDQSLHEARRGGAVYDVMVEGDCQVEEIARFNALITTAGLRAMPPTISSRDCPAGATPQPPPRPAMPNAVTPTVPAAVTTRVGSRRLTARMRRTNSRGSGQGIDIMRWNAEGMPEPCGTGPVWNSRISRWIPGKTYGLPCE